MKSARDRERRLAVRTVAGVAARAALMAASRGATDSFASGEPDNLSRGFANSVVKKSQCLSTIRPPNACAATDISGH